MDNNKLEIGVMVSAADALSDAQWRRSWSQRLEQVAELDINAAATLRRALSAEFPPDGE